jgi:hypothetical protein
VLLRPNSLFLTLSTSLVFLTRVHPITKFHSTLLHSPKVRVGGHRNLIQLRLEVGTQKHLGSSRTVLITGWQPAEMTWSDCSTLLDCGTYVVRMFCQSTFFLGHSISYTSQYDAPWYGTHILASKTLMRMYVSILKIHS